MGGSNLLVGLGGAGICAEWADNQCPTPSTDASTSEFIYTVEYENKAFDPGGGHPIESTGSGVTYWPARDSFLLLDNSTPCIHEFDASTKAYIRRILLVGFGDTEEIHWISGNTFAIADEFNSGSVDEIIVIELPVGGVDTSLDVTDATRRIQITNITSQSNKGIESFALVDGYFYFTTEKIATSPAEWNMWRVPNSGGALVLAAAEELFDITPLIGGATDISGMAADEDGMLWLISADVATFSQITVSGQLLRTVDIPTFDDDTAFAQAEGIEFFRNADGELRVALSGEDATGVDFMVLIPPGTAGPQGLPGATGASGADGLDAFTTTVSTFIVPPVDGSGTLSVATTEAFYVDQPVFIEGAGYFKIVQIPSTTELRVENFGAAPNALPNAAVVAPKKVIGAGTPGPDGVTPEGLSNALLFHSKGFGIGGGHVEWPVTPVPGYKAFYEGELLEVYDPANIVEPIADSCLDLSEPYATAHVPAGFILQPGKYHVTVRFVGFGVDAFQGRIRLGTINNASPRELTAYWVRRSSSGFTDTGLTIQGSAVAEMRITSHIPLAVWVALSATDKPTGGNLEKALGRPCSFAGEDERYLMIKVRQLERP